jgi:hypothetical protein
MGRPVFFKRLLLGTSLTLFASTNILFAEENSPSTSPSIQPGTPAPENPPANLDNSAQQNTDSKKPDDEIICKKEPPPVGTRMGSRKICKTVREWRLIQEEAKAATDEIQRNQGTKNPQGS